MTCSKAELLATIPSAEVLLDCARRCKQRNLGGTASVLRLMALRISAAQGRPEAERTCPYENSPEAVEDAPG